MRWQSKVGEVGACGSWFEMWHMDRKMCLQAITNCFDYGCSCSCRPVKVYSGTAWQSHQWPRNHIIWTARVKSPARLSWVERQGFSLSSSRNVALAAASSPESFSPCATNEWDQRWSLMRWTIHSPTDRWDTVRDGHNSHSHQPVKGTWGSIGADRAENELAHNPGGKQRPEPLRLLSKSVAFCSMFS